MKKIKPFRAISKIKSVPAIKISGVDELAKVAEVGKVYEFMENGKYFKVKVTDISVDLNEGGVYVELKELWQ